MFDQPLGVMSWIRDKLADHIGDRVVLTPEGAVLVTSTGTESSYPRPPQSLNNSQIHSTHGTQSPRAHETASSIVCGSLLHMAARVSTRNRATMEKPYFLLKVESLCEATGYPLRTHRLEDKVLDAHKHEPITVITERYLGILRFCRWSQPGHNQKLAHFISEIRVERSHSLDVLYKLSQNRHNYWVL